MEKKIKISRKSVIRSKKPKDQKSKISEKSISIERIINGIPAMIAYWDRDLMCKYANKQYGEWFGKTPAQVIGHSLNDLLGDELFKKNEPYFLAALNGEKQSFDREIKKPNGKVGYTWAQYSPDIGTDGKVCGFIATVAEITPLGKVKAELQETKDRLQLALDSIRAGIWEYHFSSKKLTWDDRMIQLHGVSDSNVPQTLEEWSALVSPSERKVIQSEIKDAVLNKRNLDIELQIPTSDQEIRFIACSSKISNNTHGIPVKMIGICRDITKKKNTEIALESKQNRLELLFQNMSEGIVIQDQNGRITEFNLAATKILGLSSDELLGRTSTDPRWQAQLPNGDPLPGSEHPSMVALRTGIPQHHLSMIVQKPDGSSSWLSVNAIPVQNKRYQQDSNVLVTFSDLTELQKTKLELESILNFVPVGIFKTDLVGNCNYVNPAWSNLTGLTEMEARGTGWSKALHFEDNDRVSQEWNKAIHSKVPFESSFRYLRPNQSVSNVYCRTRTLFDKMDKPIGYLGSVQDMTSLRISEQFNLFYRVALDQAAIVAFTDPKGKITYVNEMFCKISDYSREELIGKDHRILNSGKMGKAFFSDLWKTIATGKHWNGEICNRAKNGTYYWVSTTIVPFVNENGQIEKYIAIRRDITNEKNQQLALSEIHSALENTKDRLEIALQGSGIGVWEWDIVTKKLSWDDEMFRIYGVTPDEFSNLYDAWVNGIHPEDSKRAQHEVQLAVLDKKYFDTEFRVVDKTGHVTHVLGRGKVIRDDEGKPKKMIGINWDITKTKDNEKALEKAKKLADEANRAKSEFLASMSHEIRTPMNSIIGMADLLSESKLDSVQARQIGILKGAGDSLLTLINNILDLSKIEAGEFIVDSTEFNLETMVEKACDTLAIKAHSKQIEFALKILPEVNQYYFGDPLRLQQVLINLIGNAVKFTPKNGEISVIVDIDPSNSGHVRFRVKDSGIGLSENQMKSIFKSFVQGDANISVQYGGTGLGLAISKHLVNLMKGTIDVISKHEEGAIFYFSIPLRVSTRKEMQNPEPMSSSPIIEGRELLVVDDNTTNREIVIGYLEKWKAKATQAESGRRALEILKSHRKFDLVILDKRMPDLDGLELIRSIDNELLNRESVLMLTSDCKAEDIIEAKRLGLGAYLIKPIKRSELKLAIEDVLLRRERHFANADGTLKMIEPEKQTAKRIGADQNILVVDDNLDNIYLIQTYLKSLPFHLEIAENGESAVEKFMQGAFSAVLMDLRMKGKDGYTTTREIREWEKRNGKSRTPIIALTAYALRNEVESALQAGCDVYLTKPVLKQTLIDTLSDVMKKSPS